MEDLKKCGSVQTHDGHPGKVEWALGLQQWAYRKETADWRNILEIKTKGCH